MLEAKKFYPNIEQRREDLEKVRNRSLDFFTKVYYHRLKHIQSKGITLSNPDGFPEISNHIKLQVRDEVVDRILKAHRGESDESKYSEMTYFRAFMNDQPIRFVPSRENLSSQERTNEIVKFYNDFSNQYSDATFEQFKLKMPSMIDLALKFVAGKLKEKRADCKVSIRSNEELVDFRTLRYTTDSTQFKTLVEEAARLANISTLACELMIKMVFEKMAEHGQFAYYTRSQSNGPSFQILAC